MVMRRAVARPPVGVARLRVGGAQHLADVILQLARAGNMAKHHQTHHVVKDGHRRIVVARRALVRPKAGTIHAVAIARQATAHRAVVRLQAAATLAHRVRLEQAGAKAIAAQHRLADAAAMVAAVPTAAVAATTVAITEVDRAMAVVAVLPATVVVKVTAQRARVGATVVNHRRVAAVLAMAMVAIRAAAAGLATAAMTVAHLRRVLPTVAVTMRAALTARRVPVALARAEAAAGAIVTA